MSDNFLKETIMKTKFAATALILASGLIAGNSFAADAGALTREQVRADYLQARAEGSLPPIGEGQVVNAKSAPSTMTREAVMAEYLSAKKAGTLLPIGEGQMVQLESAPSTLTREAVKTEYLAAKKAGNLPQIGEHA